MATTEDLLEIKAQMEERVGMMRESFGVLEGEVGKLEQAAEDYKFEENDFDDNLMRNTAKQLADDAKEFAEKAHEGLKEELGRSYIALEKDYGEAREQLGEDLQTYQDRSNILTEGMHAFGQGIDRAKDEFDAGREEFIEHVGELAETLNGLAQQVFETNAEVTRSVHETQRQAIETAKGAFLGLLGNHHDSILPGQFEQLAGNLGTAVADLAGTCGEVGSAFQDEMQTLITEIMEHATHEVQSKIQEKFQQLMQEAVTYLASEITESITMTTVGAGITGAMGPILPPLAALYKATEAIKEAIKIFKALADAFG